MSDIPVDHHQTTIDELTQELESLLDTFCSDAQQRFCLEQRVASQPQLQRIRQTIQHIRNSSDLLTHSPNSDSVRQSLMRTCVEMLDCYQAVCQHRRIRALPEGATQQLTLDWQQLSQSFEMKAKEQTNLAQLFDNLKGLRKAWKKPRQIERLLTSLLVTYELRAGVYVVMIDRHNYHQLGLKRRAIGQRQLVFECSRMSRADQMEVIAGICDRFASVFAQNAQHNLAQIEAQVQLAQLSFLAKRLRKLQDQIFLTNSAGQATGDEDDVSSIDGDIGPSQMDPVPPLPFRSVAPSLWYIQDDTGIQSMPIPSFVPSPWEWPDLLQVHRPYYPILFGIIKRRRRVTTTRVPFIVRLKGLFSARTRYMAAMGPQQQQQSNITTTSTEDDGEAQETPDDPITFASVSITSLCGHFCRTGRQFYEDIASNAQLKHSQDGHILQEIGRDLVETYAAIQLEASRQHMHRILTILQDLTILDPSTHDDWEAARDTAGSSSAQPPPIVDTHGEDRRSSRIESHISLPPA
ncbi:hypothetical protein BJV82DRAFT_597495 [Fennellomyces sp. T-0311]|nr:hypothetical protein BJV82DRAFT_597495 [Fennellomyces sp. T-0311]